ncbi:MAG TPA: helix-turn-helix transcriptional regulator [Thermoanaerobaculia bacterium]|nr:helix-turn-helix transcriptional regulator [Thermoanaerobaculia bacterium]
MVGNAHGPLPAATPSALRTLAALRVLNGLSQAEVASRVRRSQRYISRLEAGEIREVGDVLLGQLSVLYGLTPEGMREALAAAREAAEGRAA